MIYSRQMTAIMFWLIVAMSSAHAAPTVVYGFDGTGQNEEYQSFENKSNVWWFLQSHRSSDESVKPVYAAGVGSVDRFKYGYRNIPGLITGSGGRDIVDSMYDDLVDNFKKGHTGIVLVGFSRGAALAREFANVIYERGNPLKYRKGKRPYGKPPTIKFMGLFDTVYSFGNPAGKVDLGYTKSIPLNVKAVAQAIAGLEKRNTFDLWSVHTSKSDYKNNPNPTGSINSGNYRIEKKFDAGHNEVGGVHKHRYNSYPALKWMIEQAREAGVRMAIPRSDSYGKGDEVDGSGNGIGKRQIYMSKKLKKVPAFTYKKAKKGCEGRQIYISGTRCYACPDGYKRFSPTRKMTHPEACTERGVSFGKKKKPAKYVWGANGCPKHQFKFKGYCMKCPEGTKRKHVAGIDSGYCKVIK